MATCPVDGAPLISTLLFPGNEFYCLECGGHFGFLEPRGVEATEEVDARYAALKAEWDANAGPKLRVVRAWLRDCEQCKPGGEYHEAHATPEEREAHAAAMTWLKERAGVTA